MSKTSKIILIVVGIIVVLTLAATILLLKTMTSSSINSAKIKSSDSSVKSNMDNILAQAELYYDRNNGSYGTNVSLCTKGVFSDPVIIDKLSQAIAAAANGASAHCSTNAAGQKYAIIIGPMNSNSTSYWCVDNSGTKKTVAATTFTAPGVCP